MKTPKDALEIAAAVLESKNIYDIIKSRSDQLVNLAIGMKQYADGVDKDGTVIKENIGDAYLTIMGLLLWFEIEPEQIFNELIEKYKDVLQ